MPDRIIFPHPVNGFVYPGYELYPINKSLLELQIDLFFDLERNEGLKRDLKVWLWEVPNATIFTPEYETDLDYNTTPRIAAAVASFKDAWVHDEEKLHRQMS